MSDCEDCHYFFPPEYFKSLFVPEELSSGHDGYCDKLEKWILKKDQPCLPTAAKEEKEDE